MARKYEVEITATAERDIQSVFDYIARENPSAAAQWIEEIEHQINSLERFPERCPIIPESEELGQGYRHLIYGNYRTIFRVESPTVLILRVVHGAQLLDWRMLEK